MTGLLVLGLVPLLAAVFFFLRAARESEARNRAEAELRQLRITAQGQEDARVAFLGIVGHELRSPLAAIMGYQELLADGIYGGLDENVLEAVRRIGLSARQLLTLTEGMEELAGSKPAREEGGGRTDPSAVLAESLADARREAEARHIQLDARIDPDLPAVRVDPDRLRNLTDALLFAAIKLARAGALHFTASADHGQLSVVVAGQGLERQPLPPASTSDHDFQITTGAGLRLAIARAMGDAVGGTLTSADSDHGPAVVLRLPAA